MTRCRSCAANRTDAARTGAACRATPPISAMPCCSSATTRRRSTPPTPRSRRRRWSTVPDGRAAVLGLPRHGRARLLLHRAVCRRVLARLARARCSAYVAVPLRRAVDPAAAVDRVPSSAGSSPNTAASPGRSTACCRRSWRVVEPVGRQRAVHADRLRRCSIRRCSSSTSI